MTSLARLEAAAARVYRSLLPTPQICWPLLSERCGCEVWVKHENHTPVGAFKVRGGLLYVDHLASRDPEIKEILVVTRGNHGQSVAFAARHHQIKTTIVVPFGNSREKNEAMRALGGELLEHGRDFTTAFDYAVELAREQDLPLVPSFHPLLVRGVATYSLELLQAHTALHTVYVPIGLGSGICGMLAARDALGLATRVVGVVAEEAPTYALSFEAKTSVETESSDTIADGIAIRRPDPEALDTILEGVDRVISVSEPEIRAAMRHYFTDTHNVAEGAGAAPLAALLKESPAMRGRKVGLVLSGGNVDAAVFEKILAAS
jgi:threonine dehydratase